nr:PAAR domain-containing protein [uncultured Rhodopila sp.]
MPGLPPIPHVAGPGAPIVLIGGLPAACVGDMCVCVGPADIIVVGSRSVMIGGRPAAHVGDATAHGGSIQWGYPA